MISEPVVTLGRMGRAGDEHDDGSPDDFDDSHHQDDEDEEDESQPPAGGGPPHPLDRLWFHPSELASFASARPGSASRTRRAAPRWVVPVTSGAIGALVTVVILAAMGTLDRSPANGPATATAARSDIHLAVSARVARHRIIRRRGRGQGCQRRAPGVGRVRAEQA